MMPDKPGKAVPGIGGELHESAAPYDHDDWPGRMGRTWPAVYKKYGFCTETIEIFRAEIKRFYQNHGRPFSWRSNLSPYRVLVSEIMLQQTQTGRVEEKFIVFTNRFASFKELAQAEFSEVLRYWKGLGYNRRAKYLHDTAALIVDKCAAILPDDPEILVRFPGIGPATAASICVFAFNKPYAFVETNIRTVYIHFFFANQTRISDKEIMALVDQSMDQEDPRQWFYGLMDYGVMLKKTVGNLSRKSSHYQKQSPFEGSDRQIRGRILDLLLVQDRIQVDTAVKLLGQEEKRILSLIDVLVSEGLIVKEDDDLRLA